MCGILVEWTSDMYKEPEELKIAKIKYHVGTW